MKTANLAIVFTDIKGFTERTSRQTYEENQRMLRIHDALLTPVFKAFSGRPIKTIGDAFLVVFESPTQAVLCGVAIQDRLWDYNRRVGPEEQIHVRVAVNLGEVRLEKGDVFGEPVNIAARVEALADAGEVLFTEAVYLAMNKAEVPAEDHGLHELKGIPEKVRVYRVPTGRYRLSASEPVAPGGVEPPFGGLALARCGLPEPEPQTLAADKGTIELVSSLGAAAADLARGAASSVGLRSRRNLRVGAGIAAVLLVGAIALLVGRDPIEKALKDGDLKTAAALVEALPEGPERIFYEGRLWEEKREFRLASESFVEAARGGDGRGYDRLLRMTEHERCRARQAAAGALGELGNGRALPALRELAEGNFPDEKGQGNSVLSQLGSSLGLSCNSRQAAERAIARLERQK